MTPVQLPLSPLRTTFSPFPELTTGRLRLRRVSEHDVNEIFVLRSDPRVLAYIRRAPAAGHEEAARFIRMLQDREAEESAITWVLSLEEDPALIGTICLWNIEKAHFRAELGYAMHPDFWGKGLMQEATEAVLQYGFVEMGVHAIEAHIDPDNTASQALLERNGFRREGYFRDRYYFEGRFYDSVVYALFAAEWRRD